MLQERNLSYRVHDPAGDKLIALLSCNVVLFEDCLFAGDDSIQLKRRPRLVWDAEVWYISAT